MKGAVLSSSGTPVSAIPGGRTPITFSNTILQPGHFTYAVFSAKIASFAASSHILQESKIIRILNPKPRQTQYKKNSGSQKMEQYRLEFQVRSKSQKVLPIGKIELNTA